jgi:uncharacterized repeat protein (TIGR01451 family)
MFKARRLLKAIHIVVSLSLILAVTASAVAQDDGGGFIATPLTPESTFSNDKGDGQNAAAPGIAGIQAGPETGLAGAEGMVSIIVKLSDESLATYEGGIAGLPATSPLVTGIERLDVNSPESQLYLTYLAEQQSTFEVSAKQKIAQAVITNHYDVVFGGVSMLVPASQVEQVAGLPGVEAVYLDELLQLETDRSPAFIGAPTVWNDLGGQESAGEGVIVGVLDTGIWPEHPSFSDPDPSGKPYAAPPPPLVGTRACEFGSAVPGDASFTCNNKLIGADRFMNTYDFFIGLLPEEFVSARDDNGHGTHTSSTAAGNANVAASIFGVSRGTISGIAPRAHVIMYKVCGDQGCFGSDSAAAVQEAIRDGVNVINFSISGGTNPYSDAVELAFLDAYTAGVFVAASAGNSGPGAETVAHRGPWVTTVAASTTDRAFKNTVTLFGAGGSTLQISGVSLTAGAGPAPVVVNTGDPLCQTPAAPGSFSGKIVVCSRGVNARVNKGFNVLQGGAAGMILYNQSTAVTDQETDNHFLPTTHIQFNEGQQVLAFLTANPGATATLTAGAASSQQGDVMASFSSRGGPGQTLGVSKPDITGPGVQILAGHTPLSADRDTGPQGELFQAIAGTSMSSPHIAGAGALIKALHPDWTPGQIKSALMTTAWTKVAKEDGVTPANAFDYGSGRVDLNVAGDPGLTFDVTRADYLAHRNDLWSVNYPSVYFPIMPGEVTVQRTAHSVLPYDSEWEVKVSAPADVKIKVKQDELEIPAGGEATFSITVDGRDVPLGQVRFAMITLKEEDGHSKNGKHGHDGDDDDEDEDERVLHIPVTFVRKQPAVTMTKSCAPATFAKKDTTTCTVTMTNTTFSPANVSMTDKLPKQLKLVRGSVVGGNASGGNSVVFSGSLAGAEPPDVSIANDPAFAGYLPLAPFGVPAIGGAGDETIHNFNVPAFIYAGETYTRIGIVSNGYVVVGGGTGADVQFINQSLPNPARPNNVLAPFWSDLNPGAGGAMRVAILAAGANRWIVVDWADVKEFSTAKTDSFEIWIGINGVQDISFTYGALNGNGDGGFLTIGAENSFGNRGANYYVDGVGTFPTPATGLVVSSTPGVPGETHTVTFTAKGEEVGDWVNYAKMVSDLFFGTNIARFAGTVTKK